MSREQHKYIRHARPSAIFADVGAALAKRAMVAPTESGSKKLVYINGAMPTYSTQGRTAENDPGSLGDQVVARAQRLDLPHIPTPYSTAGSLEVAVTQPASSHTPLEGGHFITWMLQNTEGTRGFFTTQQLAELQHTDPELFNQILERCATALSSALLQAAENTQVKLHNLLIHFGTGATDKNLRHVLGLSKGVATLPVFHAHVNALGPTERVQLTTTPLEKALYQYQSLDRIMMKFLGDDIVTFFTNKLPYTVLVSVNTDTVQDSPQAFSRFQGIELKFREAVPVQEALTHTMTCIHDAQVAFQAIMQHASTKTADSLLYMETTLFQLGFDQWAIAHARNFSRLFGQTTKQMGTIEQIGAAIDRYIALRDERDALIHQLLSENEEHTTHLRNPAVHTRLVYIAYELDRLRPSKEQVARIETVRGLPLALSEAELCTESTLTVSDPLSLTCMVKEFEQKDGQVLAKKVVIELPVIGQCGAIDLVGGYTLSR